VAKAKVYNKRKYKSKKIKDNRVNRTLDEYVNRMGWAMDSKHSTDFAAAREGSVRFRAGPRTKTGRRCTVSGERQNQQAKSLLAAALRKELFEGGALGSS